MPTRLLLAALAALLAAAPAAARKVPPPTDSASVAEARRFFTDDPDAPIVAPKGWDVTIVEYFDYQCPACRTSADGLFKLIARDKKVRVVFRDWPIFGADSAYAAMVATAAKYQGKYLAVHKALMRAPKPLTRARVEAAGKAAGADWTRLQSDLRANRQDITDLIERNEEQALMLGLSGTPGFIIGSTKSYGGMSFEALARAVRDERARAKGLPTTIRKSRKNQ